MNFPRVAANQNNWHLCFAIFREIFCILSVNFALASPSLATVPEDQVVRILVSKRKTDESSPWQYEDVVQQIHLGAYLPTDEILTTAYAVAQASDIEVQRFGDQIRHEAEVAFVDEEINLATIRLKSPIKGLSPVSLGGELALQDKIDLYRPRDTNQLTRLEASLQDTSILNGVLGTYGALVYHMKTQQSGLGWSEPLFKNGKLVGITTGQDQQFLYALPVTLIDHMLKDMRGPKYRGFPTTGLSIHPLVSQDMRRYLDFNIPGKGVRIAAIYPDSPFQELLRVDDIVVEIDGVPINDQGFYKHKLWGKIPFKYLINQHYAGDTIKIKAVRHGKTMDVSGVLNRYDSNRGPLVTRRVGTKIPHVIFGGLIMQELSVDFMKQWGKDWSDNAPIHLLYLHEFENKPGKDPHEKLIFISRILADPINRGYGDKGMLVVEAVNGLPVRSMEELKNAFSRPVYVRGIAFAKIELRHGGGEVILSYKDLEAAHHRMAKTYEIPNMESFFSMQP